MIDRELLHAYADGELAGAEKAQVEAALKQDSAAAEQLAGIRQLKSFTTSSVRPVENDDLWKTCVGRLNEIDNSKKIEGFVGKYAWALCAIFFCVIFAGGMLRHLNPNSVRTGQVASYVSGLGGGGWSRPPVESASRREWLDQKLKALGDDGQTSQLVVRGCQEGYTEDGHRLTRLVMQDSVSPLELVVVSNADSIEGGEMIGPYHTGTLNGINCVAWTQSGSAAFLIGPRDYQDLAQIASGIRLN